MTLFTNWMRILKNYRTERGKNIHQLEFRSSYVAIIKKNSLISEELKKDISIEIQLDNIKLLPDGRFAGDFSIIRAG